ncbi:GntR family transcriptional regulator [Paeniglutamicibacter terrestris]|uniref:GntR family transcriptional regulator n=1 Tax=Paeniglutamicibacter terrestris TaxID=2723403 RepID=A0ABX1G5W1_9MICC|nr:GntR family transcriptional regulator [Paeniglutamicibacter terrestris]ASN40438.1 GntR family transcriptional regulator [Arthrobacter sp. 7749]NKG21663.1 GntR family transcriptional regulator [Paeniglutamicibacter terrestris]
MSAVSAGPEVLAESISLAEQSYRDIRDRLIMLDIRPGEPINDGQLALELGVGRTPVREALKRLEIDHLVISYPRRGTFATIVDITELADVSELRRSLEPLAARKAALSASDADREALRALARDIERLEEKEVDKRGLMEYDLSVHRLIYRAAGNHHLEETLIRLDNLATRIWCLVLDKVPSVAGHIEEHVDLLDAIVAGNAATAETLALAHITSFEQTIRAVL